MQPTVCISTIILYTQAAKQAGYEGVRVAAFLSPVSALDKHELDCDKVQPWLLNHVTHLRSYCKRNITRNRLRFPASWCGFVSSYRHPPRNCQTQQQAVGTGRGESGEKNPELLLVLEFDRVYHVLRLKSVATFRQNISHVTVGLHADPTQPDMTTRTMKI